MHNRICSLLIIGLAFFSSCLSAGTHGSIKAYQYNVPKYELEKVVHQVIIESSTIYQDSIKDYYNDDTNYVTIRIIEKSLPYKYVFHFYGGKEYWDTSKTSAISIAYAYNVKNEGGSEGGKIKEHGEKFIHELIRPFEKEFISKIDSLLNMKHAKE